MGFWEFVGAVGGLAGAGAGIWAALKAKEANYYAGRANETAVESRQEAEKANQLSQSANSLSAESNRIASEANSIAREAIERQQRAENLDHSASLIFAKDGAGRRRNDPDGPALVVAFTNVGAVDARHVQIQIRRMGDERWIGPGDAVDIPANGTYNFAFKIGPDFFRLNEGGQLLEYRITYKDRLDGHEKWYRVQLSGMWETSWNGKALAGKLDGKPITIFGVEGLAPGIAFEAS